MLKQRLVGAIILTSLAIILLPLLLDGSPEGRELVVPRIPEPPQVELSSDRVDNFVADMRQMESTSKGRLPKEVVDDTDYEVVEDFVLDQNQLPVSWSLQVGSFRQQDNATKLREKLRADNYRAYVLGADNHSGKIWRVFVGPMVNKQALAELSTELEGKLDLKGRIVRYRIEEDAGQLGG